MHRDLVTKTTLSQFNSPGYHCHLANIRLSSSGEGTTRATTTSYNPASVQLCCRTGIPGFTRVTWRRQLFTRIVTRGSSRLPPVYTETDVGRFSRFVTSSLERASLVLGRRI